MHRLLAAAAIAAALLSSEARAQEETPVESPSATPTSTPETAATATPTPAPTPELPVAVASTSWQTGFFANHITQWPAEITLAWELPLAPRAVHPAIDIGHVGGEQGITAAFDISPFRGLALGGDVIVDTTKTLAVPLGGQGCSAYVQHSIGTHCWTSSTDDVYYLTQTYMLTAWAKPYVTFGPFRVFAGVGASYANIDYLYSKDQALTDDAWGKGSTTSFGVIGQAGAEWAYPLSPNGACFIIETRVTAGSPRYGEHVVGLFFTNQTWSSNDVGTVTNPLRAAIALGFTFPTANPPARVRPK